MNKKNYKTLFPLVIIQMILKYFPKGLIAFDLETTGLSPFRDKIIEISAVKINSDQSINIFNQLINPEIPIKNFNIHGIKDDMVKSSPSIKEVLTNFNSFTQNIPLLAHNARFDSGFIIYNSFLHSIPISNNNIFDSFIFSHFIFKNKFKKFGLKNLCIDLQIQLENHHRALDDSIGCALIFTKMLEELDQQNLSQAQKITRLNKKSLLYNMQDFTLPIDNIPTHLQVLNQLTESQEKVLIRYMSGSRKGQLRPIKPISLLPLPSGIFLYALCVESNLHKNYALKRIEEVVKC